MSKRSFSYSSGREQSQAQRINRVSSKSLDDYRKRQMGFSEYPPSPSIQRNQTISKVGRDSIFNINGDFHGTAQSKISSSNAKGSSDEESVNKQMREKFGDPRNRTEQKKTEVNPKRENPTKFYPHQKYESFNKFMKIDDGKDGKDDHLIKKRKTQPEDQISKLYKHQYPQDRFGKIYSVKAGKKEIRIFNFIEPRSPQWLEVAYHVARISRNLIDLISTEYQHYLKRSVTNPQIGNNSLREKIIDHVRKYKHSYLEEDYFKEEVERVQNVQQQTLENIEVAQNHVINMFSKEGVWVPDAKTLDTGITRLQCMKLNRIDIKKTQIEYYPLFQDIERYVKMQRVIFCPSHVTTGKVFSQIVKSYGPSLVKINTNFHSTEDYLLYQVLTNKIYALKNEVHKLLNRGIVTREVLSWAKEEQLPPKLIILNLKGCDNIDAIRNQTMWQCYEINEMENNEGERKNQLQKTTLHRKYQQLQIPVVVFIKGIDHAINSRKYRFPTSITSENIRLQTIKIDNILNNIRTLSCQFQTIIYCSNSLDSENISNLHLSPFQSCQINTIKNQSFQLAQKSQFYLDAVERIIDQLYFKAISNPILKNQFIEEHTKFQLEKIKLKLLSLSGSDFYCLCPFSIRQYFSRTSTFESCHSILEGIQRANNIYWGEKLSVFNNPQSPFGSNSQSLIHKYPNEIFKIGNILQKSLASEPFENQEFTFMAKLYKKDFVEEFTKINIFDHSNGELILKIHPKTLIYAIRSNLNQLSENFIRSNQLILSLLEDPTQIGCIFQKLIIQMLTLGETRLVLPYGHSKDTQTPYSLTFQNFSPEIMPFVTIPTGSPSVQFDFFESFMRCVGKSKDMKVRPVLFLPVGASTYQTFVQEQNREKHLKSKIQYLSNAKDIDFISCQYNAQSQNSPLHLQLTLYQSTIKKSTKIISKISDFIVSYLLYIDKKRKRTITTIDQIDEIKISMDYIVLTTKSSQIQKICLDGFKIEQKVKKIMYDKESMFQNLEHLVFETQSNGHWMNVGYDNGRIVLNKIGIIYYQDLEISNQIQSLDLEVHKKLMNHLLEKNLQRNKQKIEQQAQDAGRSQYTRNYESDQSN